MRFRKRVKVFPGFSLNFSNSGISSTVGVKGANINFSKRGTYFNSSIPGTGLYDRQKIGGFQNSTSSTNNFSDIPENSINIPEILIGEIKSADPNELTSTNLAEIKESLLEAYNDRNELTNEIFLTQKKIKTAKVIHTISQLLIFGLFIKSFKNNVVALEEYFSDIKDQLENSFVDIDILFENTFEDKYLVMVDKYKELLNSNMIWDITSSHLQDMKLTRSAASTVVTRQQVRFKFDNIEIIKSKYQAFHLENKNGGDLYIYPAFIIMLNKDKRFALIDIYDFDLNFSEQKFLEEEKVPNDTKIIDKTWAKVNKNGTPDKRFNGNYEIPIVLYGEINVTSKYGLNESYSFSSFEKSKEFAEVFNSYKSLFN